MKNDDSRPDSADRDDIATLIRAAGRRQAVPADRTMRVKAALHERWTGEISRRRRRRYLWATVTLAAAASLVLFLSLPGMRPNPAPAPDTRIAGTVESVAGVCWTGDHRDADSKGERSLEIRQELAIGSFVTTGEQSRISLRLKSGYAVKLDRSSRVRLVGPGVLVLDAGAVYIDSEHSGENAGTLRIQTPLGTIQEIGTRYEVRLRQGSVRVRVREGLVILDDGSRSHQIQAAGELTIDEMGVATMQEIATEGAEWNWIAELSSMPDLKGLSAREFLEWVARERNWRLVFATENLSRSASEIVLGGSADGLTLEESLDAVLPTCGMGYRVEDDALIVTHAVSDPPHQ